MTVGHPGGGRRRRNSTLYASRLGVCASVKRSWATAFDLAGVRDFRFYDRPHTPTTRIIADGFPHTEVMKVTGHLQTEDIPEVTENNERDSVRDHVESGWSPAEMILNVVRSPIS